jgi:hypothetical protein
MGSQGEERSSLHARAQTFIEESAAGGPASETFEAIALAIARYQARHVPAYARLLAAADTHPSTVATVRALPAVPTDAFRFARIAAHPPSEDAAVFRTSGTTGGARGEHPLWTTKTYEDGALAWGRWALFFDLPTPMTAIVLGQRPSSGGSVSRRSGDSSLSFMLALFADRFTHRTHYLESARGVPVDTATLEAACSSACRDGAPTVVMGTSFAFVHALDTLAGARVALPARSRAMHTGGFKGRSREVAPEALTRDIAATFGLELGAVVGEYGMTELSSQLYEGVLRAHLGQPVPSSRPGCFIPPPWLRVSAADPDTLAPLPTGETGILRFEDLANVDSAIVVQTADVGRCAEGGVELLGRAAGAPPRGCSLAIEELLAEA